MNNDKSNKPLLNIDTLSILDYKLGNKEPEEFKGDYYQNFKKGYGIYLANNQISTIVIYLREGYEKFNAFTGAIIFNKNEYFFDKNTTFEEVISIFGQPKDQWNDRVEMCAEYSKKNLNQGFDIEILWHVDGDFSLDYISIELAR